MLSARGGTETPTKTWVKEVLKYTDLNTIFSDIYSYIRGKVRCTGDTMTGDLVMDGADIKSYDSKVHYFYSDNGSTLLAEYGSTGFTLYY